MRCATLLVIILTAMVTQSCRIEAPFLAAFFEETQSASKLLRYTDNSEYYYAFFHDLKSSVAIKKQGGFRDTLIIGDLEPPDWHGSLMYATIHRIGGIPKKNIFFLREFLEPYRDDGNRGLKLLTSGDMEELRRATRVVHIPQTIPLRHEYDLPKIASNNIVFIWATGNMVGQPAKYGRDWHSLDHWFFGRDSETRQMYEDVMAIQGTGKVLAATSARVSGNTVQPYSQVAQCGDIKEHCFTILPEHYTSSASARLSAISFYLSQLFDNAEEVIEVLQTCAIDVGEHGIDREFGQGVVNLWCPQVLKKEMEIVSGHTLATGYTVEQSRGGTLGGSWKAEEGTLQVYLPTVLRETTKAMCSGTVNGTIDFQKNAVSMDFTVNAEVSVHFLTMQPMIAHAEDEVKTSSTYSISDTLLTVHDRNPLHYTYTAREDSLFLTRSLSLNDVLRLLPGVIGNVARKTDQDIFADSFVNDDIIITMGFGRTESKTPEVPGDFNGDGIVNIPDFLLFLEAFGATRGDREFNEEMDLVPDGIINVADFLVFAEQFGKTS